MQHSKSSSKGEWVNKLWDIQAMKRSELSTQQFGWISKTLCCAEAAKQKGHKETFWGSGNAHTFLFINGRSSLLI